MSINLLSIKFLILYAFIGSAIYIHFRGKDRLKFSRQITDHSTFMAPYNLFMYLCSAVPNKPILDMNGFPDLAKLRDNWQTIRDEAMALYEAGGVRSSEKKDDLAFNSFFKHGWKRFYLKWYDDIKPSAREKCPKTVELIESIPSINAAMFTLLSPRSKLPSHRDPFAGSLRYHLGLKTPNSENCRIFIDGESYHWTDGGDILFDETYVHRVKNDTDEYRLILFCDVARPMANPVARGINRFVTNHIVKASEASNEEGEKVGILNRLFGYVYAIRDIGKRMKKWNRPVYYLTKYVVFAGLFYLVFILL